jgi:hypothetical protein
MIHWLMSVSAPVRYGALAVLGVWGWLGMAWLLRRATRSGERAAERAEELASPASANWDQAVWRRYRHRGKHHKPGRWDQLTSGLVTWDH